MHRLVQAVTRHGQADDTEKPALGEALGWIDDAFVGDPEDVCNWPVIYPLAPHAQAAAIHAADSELDGPSARLLNQVGLLLAVARSAEAEPLIRRALEINEARFGKDHPNVARDLNSLARVLQDTNRLTEAKPLMCRALLIVEARFGKDHEVAIQLNNLAGLLQPPTTLPEAELLLRRALKIDEAISCRIPQIARLGSLAGYLRRQPPPRKLAADCWAPSTRPSRTRMIQGRPRPQQPGQLLGATTASPMPNH